MPWKFNVNSLVGELSGYVLIIILLGMLFFAAQSAFNFFRLLRESKRISSDKALLKEMLRQRELDLSKSTVEVQLQPSSTVSKPCKKKTKKKIAKKRSKKTLGDRILTYMSKEGKGTEVSSKALHKKFSKFSPSSINTSTYHLVKSGKLSRVSSGVFKMG